MNYLKIKNYKEICGNATYYTYGGLDINKIVGNYEYENECYIGYNGEFENDENITLITKELFDDNYNKLNELKEIEKTTLEDKVKILEEQNTILENAILDLANIVGGVQ